MANSYATVLRALLSPQIVIRHIIRSHSLGSVEFRLSMGALEKAQYAFGIKQAIYLASRLNHKKVSVLEFGVGTGRGLKLMEKYAAELGKPSGIDVQVFGFDLGSGLPPAADYRDLPYAWRSGDYSMDEKQLRRELKTAKLMLGDVRHTVPQFLEARPAPIGFISFDLDYYSSTIAAFRIFECPDEAILPRVVCYFDDLESDERQYHCEYVGERLAISEFNCRAGSHHKLCHTYIHSPTQKYPAPWRHQNWIYHRFSHPEYNTYIQA